MVERERVLGRARQCGRPQGFVQMGRHDRQKTGVEAKFWRFSVSAALWISPPTHPLLSLRELVFGRTARGAPSDPPLDRRTGQSRVDAKPGDYSDAIAKGNSVHLLATESTGAVSLRCLAPADPAAQGRVPEVRLHHQGSRQRSGLRAYAGIAHRFFPVLS